MRFIVKLKSAKASMIDIDYRRRFISFMKAVFGENFNKFGETKPYVFCVYFGREAKFRKESIENVKEINLRFSTGDFSTAITFYNGVLKLKKEGYTHKIGDSEFRIEWIKKEDEKEFNGIFKTLCPVIVERIGFENLKDVEERYITPDEKDFEISLLENILRRYRSIKGKETEVKNFKFIDLGTKKVYIKHYGGYLKGFLGKFKIETESNEILKFIYDFGVGLRTGQGFGYLEVGND